MLLKFWGKQPKGPSYGLFLHNLPVPLPAGAARRLLLPQGHPLAQRRAVGVFADLLQLRGAGVGAGHDRRHPHQLVRGAQDLPHQAETDPKAPAGVGRNYLPRPAGLLQILLLPHQHGLRPPRHGSGGSRAAPAHRHLLLHLPGADVYRGRVPQEGEAPDQPLPDAPLHLLLPPAHRRAHRPVRGRGGGADRPEDHAHGLLPGPAAVRAGSREEGAAGQPLRRDAGSHRPGRHRGEPLPAGELALRGPLHHAALLRLLRLLRHGHRPRPHLRLHLQGEL